MDGVARDRAMSEKLDLPFRLLADERATAAAAWGVYDATARIALPAMFAVMPDLTIPWAYLGDDYADRPPLDELFAALDAARRGDARPLRRVAPLGPREPADSGKRPIPLEELPPYFRGASYAVSALASRSSDPAMKAEAARYRELVTGFLRHATATLEARRRRAPVRDEASSGP